jgi:predicted  nucleic acid-binding Zn-ribbon protein
LAGVSLLLGINNTVINANVPLFSQINEVANNQSNVEKKIEALSEKISKQQESLQALIAKSDSIAALARGLQVVEPQQPPQPQQPPAEDFK